MANTTTGIVLGTYVGLYLTDKKVLLAKQHTIKISTATRDTGTKDSNEWEESAPGKLSWEMTISGLTSYDPSTTGTTSDALIDAQLARTVLEVKYSTLKTGDRLFSGNVIITEFSADDPDAENSTYSVTLKGTGPLAKSVVAAA